MFNDYSYGVIPVLIKNGQPLVLLILHQKGHWAFPKGHAESSETPLETARRELQEETGIIDIDIKSEPTFLEHYIFTDKDKGVINKEVIFYIGFTQQEKIKIQEAEVADYGWFNLTEAKARMTFDQGKKIIDQLHEYFDNK